MVIRVRNQGLFEKAVLLRKSCKSYFEIKKELGISKSTLSSWFGKDKWSNDIKCKLAEKNRERSREWGILMGARRSLEKQKRLSQFRDEAQIEYPRLVGNPLFVTGISLYWGEGDKTQLGRVSIISSDVTMIKLMLNFFLNILQISKSKIRAGLFLYNDHNVEDLLSFWSDQLKIPQEQFIKTQILPSRSRLTKRKTTYGMCSLYFCDTQMSTKLQEWIKIHAAQYMRV